MCRARMEQTNVSMRGNLLSASKCYGDVNHHKVKWTALKITKPTQFDWNYAGKIIYFSLIFIRVEIFQNMYFL